MRGAVRDVVVDEFDKREALRNIVRAEDVRNALIFCNRKRDVDILFRSLKKHGFNTAALHGDMSQPERTATLEAFKANEITLLVASDVAARGLDIIDLSHVFNFDVPIHAEDYVHRIGRTGRAGKAGRSFTLAMPGDAAFVEAIVKLIGKEIPAHEIDGIETRALDDPGERRRGRGRGRSKPADGGAKRAPRKPARAAKTEKPEKSDTSETDKPRAKRRGRNAKSNGAAKERPQRAPKERSKDNSPVVGMGDHTPAFMLRPGRTESEPREG